MKKTIHVEIVGGPHDGEGWDLEVEMEGHKFDKIAQWKFKGHDYKMEKCETGYTAFYTKP